MKKELKQKQNARIRRLTIPETQQYIKHNLNVDVRRNVIEILIK